MADVKAPGRADDIKLLLFLIAALICIVGLIGAEKGFSRSAGADGAAAVGSPQTRTIERKVLEENFASGHFAKRKAMFAHPVEAK